jgi:uncharacterized membrane protein YeaQ/YmgE (transglycosylase-associated protein family)
MHILGWILFGLVVGVVAKLIMPGRDPGGFVITALLGSWAVSSAGSWAARWAGTGKAILLASSWP